MVRRYAASGEHVTRPGAPAPRRRTGPPRRSRLQLRLERGLHGERLVGAAEVAQRPADHPPRHPGAAGVTDPLARRQGLLERRQRGRPVAGVRVGHAEVVEQAGVPVAGRRVGGAAGHGQRLLGEPLLVLGRRDQGEHVQRVHVQGLQPGLAGGARRGLEVRTGRVRARRPSAAAGRARARPWSRPRDCRPPGRRGRRAPRRTAPAGRAPAPPGSAAPAGRHPRRSRPRRGTAARSRRGRRSPTGHRGRSCPHAAGSWATRRSSCAGSPGRRTPSAPPAPSSCRSCRGRPPRRRRAGPTAPAGTRRPWP